MIKRTIIIIIFLFFLPVVVNAACSGSSPTWTAASASSTDVNACITAATAGDTINVPSGSATWGSGAVTTAANKPLKIIGAGAGNTIITVNSDTNTTAAFTVLAYAGSLTTQTATRISGFTFQNTGTHTGLFIRVDGQGWRIDHCIFINPLIDHYYAAFAIFTYSSSMTMQPYGLIDNNTFYHCKIDSGVLAPDVEVAAWADSLDLGGLTAVYGENNIFYNNDNDSKQLAWDANYAAKRVLRYNTFVDQETNGHPLQSNGDRGERKAEYYNNLYTQTGDYEFAFNNIGAGTGIMANNRVTGSSGYNNYFTQIEYKRDYDNRCGSQCGCLGGCDGTHAWDGNESGQSGWLCRDQPGAGGDSGWPGYDSNCNGTPTAQTKVPWYIWNNTGIGTAETYNTDTLQIQENRDYYKTSSSFTGATGVGCGTLANRPATCTTGVGYWVPNTTDDPTAGSCSDLTNFAGANATYHGAGTLYKCTATNTWSTYFVPYSYPHPLAAEGGGGGGTFASGRVAGGKISGGTVK